MLDSHPVSWLLILGNQWEVGTSNPAAQWEEAAVPPIEQSTLFWQRPPKTFHPDSNQTVNPHQVWSWWAHCTIHQSAVQLSRHMVPTDTFTLCCIISPNTATPFQFDQYQRPKWLSATIKTSENQHFGVLMQISTEVMRGWTLCYFVIFSYIDFDTKAIRGRYIRPLLPLEHHATLTNAEPYY